MPFLSVNLELEPVLARFGLAVEEVANRGREPPSALREGEQRKTGRERVLVLMEEVARTAQVRLEGMALHLQDERELVLVHEARELLQGKPERQREAAARRIVVLGVV